MNKADFINKAIKLAEENVRHGGGPFGCVIVKDNIIIAEGQNHVTQNNDPTAHAEIVAIRNACLHLDSFQLENCEIYSSCEPCPMCLGAIYWARPKKVYYAASRFDAAKHGFDDQLIYSEIQLEPGKRIIPFEIIATENKIKPFQLWDNSPNKVNY